MGKLKGFISKNKNSLKTKLVVYQLILFTIFIIGFEIFTFITIREYYYNNLKSNMLSQAEYSLELYSSSVSGYSLSEIISNERFEFLNNMKGKVQILDNSGKLLYDNTGGIKLDTNVEMIEQQSDIVFSFYEDTENKLLILNYPIINKNNQVGVLRNITSIKIVENEISMRMAVFILFGAIAVFLSIIINYIFGNSFLAPIKKLNNLASKLSNGQYNERSNMPYIGEIGELAKTMDEMSENIINKEEIKQDFISSVSHELRTPLTSIKGWAITLQDKDIEQETINDGLTIIEKESDRLAGMVEDLLNFSRYTSPKFSLTKSEFNIILIVKNIINQLSPRAKEKNINMVYNHEDYDVNVIADENRLKQVFINLIDNALKFTDNEGTILVNIQDGEDEIKCQITDTGIGISEDEIDLVTTKFYKGSSSQSHTGLGLSICEEIVLLHNGKFEISSIEDEGTTVSFTIPKGVRNEN